MSEEPKTTPETATPPAAPAAPLALVLLDIGAPTGPAEVGAYLQRLYADPNVLQMSLSGAFLELIAWGVSLSRRGALTKAVAGAGAPTEKAALEQLALVVSTGLAASLGRTVHPFVAFRHAEPGIRKVLEQAKAAGCRRVAGIFVRTFASSAGSRSMRTLLSLEAEEFSDLDVSMLDGLEDDPGVRKAFAGEALEALGGIPEAERKDAHLLFLVQGQPVRGKEDPTLPRARAWAEALRADMGVENGFSVAYQNGVDPCAALLPEAGAEIARLAAEKRRAIVLAPISHPCEGAATRWECDQVLVEAAKRAGFAHVRRARAPAEGAGFRAAFEGLVRRHLDDMERLRAAG